MKIFGVAMAAAAILAVVVVLATTGMSAAQSDDSAPVAPSDLAVTLDSTGSTVNLAWTPGQNLPEGYAQQVEHRDASVSPPSWTAWAIKSTSTNSYAIATKDRFLPEKTYIFQVAVVMTKDPVTWGFSNEVSLTMPAEGGDGGGSEPEPEPADDSAPVAPSDLKVTLDSAGNTVNLTWTPGQNLPEGHAQQVEHRDASVSPPNWTAWAIKSTSTGSFAISTKDRFLPEKTYLFQVAVVMSEDPITWGFSNEASLTMPAEAGDGGGSEPEPEPAKEEPPAGEPQPTNLKAATSNGQVTLTWTPGNDDTYTAQEVKRRTIGVKGWATIRIDASASEYVDDDVTVGKKYVYRVKGVWDNGKGRLSRPVRVTAR